VLDHDLFVGELALLRASGAELDHVLKKVSATYPGVARQVQEFSRQFGAQQDNMARVVTHQFFRGDYTTDPQLFFAQATTAIDLGYQQMQQLLIPTLQNLLQARIDRMQRLFYLGAALAAGLVLLYLYFAIGAYLSVMTSIQTLRRGADRMAAGDLGTRIALTTRDELRSVADSFNHMGAQLALRTQQLEKTDATLAQLLRNYEKDHPQAVLAAVVPAISHDLNTALGNAKLAASTLNGALASFRQKLASPDGLRRAELMQFVNAVDEGLRILASATHRSMELATNLKQVSIDQASERRRSFALDKLVDEVLTLLAPSLRTAHWRIETKIAANLMMDSYPGPLGQVLLNLFQNAALHAFAEGQGSLLLVQARPLEGARIAITVQDDGCGMAPDTLAKVFDPFFSTKIGSGGSGVGLTYARKLVRDTLGGTLEAASAPGAGTTFTLVLPRVAPQNGNAAAQAAHQG
jgi:signal transduction histidine kinase